MSKTTAFPLDESKLPFSIPRDEPFRENIAKLGQIIREGPIKVSCPCRLLHPDPWRSSGLLQRM